MWVSMPRTPIVGVGQVDEHVPGWIQVGGGRGHGHGLAGADLAGDHPDCTLIHTPGDAGDRFTVSGVVVQHGWCQVGSEGHSGESPMWLQPLNTHADTPPSSSTSTLG